MDRYAAIWTKEPGPAWVARHRMTSAKYQQEFNKLTSQGFRLVHISGYNFGGQARFAAIWEKSQGPAWAARHNMTAKQYQQEFDKHVKLGYRLIQVSAYRGLGQDLYAAIWRKEFGSSNDAGSQRQEETERQEEMQRQGETVTARSEFSPSSSRSVTPTQRIPASGPAWVARHRMTAARYQNEFNKLAQKGFRLVDISGCRIADHGRYAAIWEKKAGPPWVARHGTQSSSYQQEFDNLVGQGFRLRHINGFRIGGQVRFATIWEKSQGPAWVARHNMTAEQYQQEFDKQIKLGYRLVCVSGY